MSVLRKQEESDNVMTETIDKISHFIDTSTAKKNAPQLGKEGESSVEDFIANYFTHNDGNLIDTSQCKGLGDFHFTYKGLSY